MAMAALVVLSAVVYTDLPPEVEKVVAYGWLPGGSALPIEASLTRDGSQATVTLASSSSVVITLQRRDGAYLLDGPIAVSQERTARRVDRTWRRTVHGGVLGAIAVVPAIAWMPASGAIEGQWPACWWSRIGSWTCMGVPLGTAGVVIGMDGQRLWSAVLRGPAAASLTASSWGRLIVVRDRDEGPPPRLKVTTGRPVVAAQRPKSVRVETAAMADVRVTPLNASAVWMAGDSSPPSAWVEIRSARSGPVYLSLADVAEGAPQVALPVVLGETRGLDVTVGSDRAGRAAGALVTVFRLIDPASPPGGREPPARRVFVSEAVADADGRVRIEGLGDAAYEIVAWHAALGRASMLLPAGAERVTIGLQSPGLVRGRVLAGGKAAPGAEVIVVPDPAAAADAVDLIDLTGGAGRAGSDGRFAVTTAPGGGGELRVGGGTYPTRRVPLPRAPLPIVDLGDIELGRAIAFSLVLDQDPGCDVRAAGPIGRTGLQIVTATRTAPGVFSMALPEEGSWEFSLLCGADERALTPAVVRIAAPAPSSLTFLVR